jgi:hypothetical protein
VWTPKRIILLAGSFVVFTLVYLIYTLTALGRINTLPPLPDQYKPSEGEKIVRPPRPIRPTLLERKLEMAFYPGCEELKWPVRLELNAKSMVIAAWKFELADRGRVKLELMSLALFGKKKNDGRDIEINTLKCKQAYITFDQPIHDITLNQFNGRKVVEAELFGDTKTPIVITNNRRTAVRSDDLVVRINTGPLYYIEKTQIVKTSDRVNLIDGASVDKEGQLLPPKAVINAKGMEMELQTSAPPPRPSFLPHKPKSDSITGVKRIVLKEDVDMKLRVADGGPFPSNDKASGTTGGLREKHSGRAHDPARQPAGEAARIHIETPGRFEYEIFKDHDMARFDVPKDADQPNSPQDVTVTRINEQNGNVLNDMLVCKHLELRLKRRNNDAPVSRDAAPGEQGLEIETAHATGPDVTLTSDAEKLDAHGVDFFHDAAQKLTILKGAPYMEANKEDSLIQAPELRIQDVPLPDSGNAATPVASAKKGKPQPKTFQQIQASGPGCIHMTNKTTGKQNTHAFWNERLLSTRDGAMDLLTLTGSARFVDDEHQQSLQAETLKVWLLSEDKKTSAVAAKNAAPAVPTQSVGARGGAAAPTGVPGNSRRPHRVEALRNVLAHSPDLNIHDAARLVINFCDVPPERMPPPATPKAEPQPSRNDGGAQLSTAKVEPRPSGSGAQPIPPGGGADNHSLTVMAPNRPSSQPVATTSRPSDRPVTVAAPTASEPQLLGSGSPQRSLTVAAPNSRPATETPRPIDLSARSIEAKVLRCAERMTLDHLWAEGGSADAIDKRGGVVVRQEPAKKGEEGVYIEGNTLDMSCYTGGNVLVVTGDLAQLKMDKIFILGPEVNINQVANRAWVFGAGAMEMHSTTTLEGKPLAHPVPLTVHWSDKMLFAGTFADFDGSIQAEQDNARLACQHLQVYFDRPISLKEGMRGSQPAKVSRLVGDKGDDGKPVRVEDQTVEAGRLQKYQLLLGSAIHMNTEPRDEDDRRDASPTASSPSGKNNNDANKVTLSGPGSVRILQRGGAEMAPTPAMPAPAARPPAGSAAPEQEMKLTYVQFVNQMQASSLTNVASFWGAVRVLNLPCDDPHREIDLDAMLSIELPEGALYLRCDRLRVGTYQKVAGAGTKQKQLRTYQVMDALGQVYVQGKNFSAQCDHMTFNEEKDQVVFIGDGDNMAVLSMSEIKGGPRKVIKAKKITYIRSTGEAFGRDINSIDG